MPGSLTSRRKVLALGLLGAVALVAAGFGAGQAVKSPQEAAADAEGPGPTTLTVPVERRELVAKVVLRGDVAASMNRAVVGPVSAEGSSVVTRVRTKRGQRIKPGVVLVEVAGRPVFALKGSVPAYRDLRPGYTGNDVEQFQSALADLGFDPGERGTYGAETKAAVRKLYESLGYEPRQTSKDVDELVASAERAVREAERAVADAEYELEQMKGASAETRAAEQAVVRAREDLRHREEEYDRVVAETGPIVPLGEYFFVPSFPSRVTEIKASPGKPAPTPLLTITTGELRAVGIVSAGKAGLISTGQAVDVVSESHGSTARGKVASFKQRKGKSPNGNGYQLVVKPVGDWSPKLSGTNVRLTVNGASTKGAKLIVPVSALFATTDGSTKVTVQRTDRTTRDVTVAVGVHADGYAAVKPIGGALRESDQVVVSAENASAWSTS